MRRVPWELLALPALGISRLLPDTGWGLWVRLAAATACLLLPGALLARALRVPSSSRPRSPGAWARSSWRWRSCSLVHASLTLALILLALIAAGARRVDRGWAK